MAEYRQAELCSFLAPSPLRLSGEENEGFIKIARRHHAYAMFFMLNIISD